MIWLITIVTFFSAVIAVMLVYWFILQREQILAALRQPQEHRMEARISRRVGLELSGPDEPLIYETTFTENVSRHGARVVTKRRWSPNESVLVKLPQESLPARARITYCQPSKDNEFAMGLQFSLVIYDWIGLPLGGNAFQWVRETVLFGTQSMPGTPLDSARLTDLDVCRFSEPIGCAAHASLSVG
jgi:PilZ domain